MKSFGMDVIPICGDQLAEIEGVGELGLILEHEIDSETEQFEELVEDMKVCLHHLGWIGEFEENITIH